MQIKTKRIERERQKSIPIVAIAKTDIQSNRKRKDNLEMYLEEAINSFIAVTFV